MSTIEGAAAETHAEAKGQEVQQNLDPKLTAEPGGNASKNNGNEEFTKLTNFPIEAITEGIKAAATDVLQRALDWAVAEGKARRISLFQRELKRRETAATQEGGVKSKKITQPSPPAPTYNVEFKGRPKGDTEFSTKGHGGHATVEDALVWLEEQREKFDEIADAEIYRMADGRKVVVSHPTRPAPMVVEELPSKPGSAPNPEPTADPANGNAAKARVRADGATASAQGRLENGKQYVPAGSLPVHPFALIFPPLTDAQIGELAADMKANGQSMPATVYQGQIIDGRNRDLAAAKAAVPLWIEERSFPDNGAALRHVTSANMTRRHLDESQRAMVAARLAEKYAELARHNMSDGGKGLANLPTLHSRDQAAKDVGVSPRLVQDAKKVIARGDAVLVAAVEAGSAKVSAAAAVAELPPEQQKKVVAGGKKEIKKAAKKVRDSKKQRNHPKPKSAPAAPAATEASNPESETSAPAPADDGSHSAVAGAAKILDDAARDFDGDDKRSELAQAILNGRRPEIVLGQWKTAAQFAADMAVAIERTSSGDAAKKAVPGATA